MEAPMMSLLDLYNLDTMRAVHTTSLLACTSWLLTHRMLLNQGFVLRRKGLSTDTIASLVIGSASTLWTLAVLRHVHTRYFTLLDSPSWNLDTVLEPLSELGEAPLLSQVLFGFWLLSYFDGLLAENIRRAKPHLWSLTNLRGPFDWASGVHQGFYWTLILCMCVSVGLPALACLLVGDPIVAILNLAGVLLFVLNGTASNPYVAASHRYADDRLRIALPTSHHEGTLYMLPSKQIGIDAVWSPKIKNEHLEADGEIMTLFQHMRSGRWAVSEPLERLRTTLAKYQERVLLSTEQAERLAAWIYVDKSFAEPSLSRISCDRAPNTHLIGRDLMYALCHAEYLVFMAQGKLSPATRQKLGTLRLMSRSGAGADPDTSSGQTIGFSAGFDGYQEAVKHVYDIFSLPVDDSALDFPSTAPPRWSSALSKQPSGIEEYVAELWDLSTANTESTFSALYFFTTVWFMELGNVNGFHIFPLRCKTRVGDLVSQQIAWRQAWYAGIIAQLVASGPVWFGAFVLGYLR